MSKLYSVEDLLEDQSNRTVWDLAWVLKQVIEDNMETTITCKPTVIESDFVNTVWKGKKWTRNYDTHFRMELSNDYFQLSLNAVDQKTIELFYIKVYVKGDGIGSGIMECLCAAAQALGITINLIPVAINTTNDIKKAEKLSKRLRKWYGSMQFASNDDTPEMQLKH